MTERDDDIEFDFFEDLEPAEPPSQERTMRLRRTGPPGPPGRRPPPRAPAAIAPLFRLAGLIAFAILVIVLLVFWIKSCQGSGKKASYRTYMTAVSEKVVKPSTAISRDLNTALTTPGVNQGELADKLDGLWQTQQQVLDQAEAIGAPGTLRPEHSDMLEAVGLRVSGLQGLAKTFRETAGSKDVTGTAGRLAEQAQRLTASDIVWDDLFRARAVQELKNQGVGGVSVPESHFVRASDFSSQRYWEPIVERLSGSTGGGDGGQGGLHGTGIVSVKAGAGSDLKDLDPDVENTVTATTDLAFAVTVEDTGDSQEVQIKVTLTIVQTPTPITKTLTIDVINPQEQKTVTFRNLGQVQFATRTTVKVDVKPVTGEANTSNNSLEFPVIFSLG